MSTYSPSLRIELIATGDQAGTWGNTTNTNLGTLIESGICGYTSVAVSAANQALTALNGVADESRNMVLALTTSTGAAFNVYAPPAEKVYVVYNASAYAATIYNSTVLGNTTAAGTGVVVPAGKTVTVWSDGTNFAVQNTYTPSLTVGSLDLSAPLAVTSGGTGATTATNARTNLGLGTIATQNANSVSITGGSISGITDLAIADGGTGQSTANGAFNALAPSQTGQSGKYLKTDGTNTSWDQIDISTADITGILPLANGGTGATTAVAARSNLGLGTIATQDSSNVTITGGNISGITDLAVADGGTGASTASGARTNLGLGTMSTQDSSNIGVTGGSISGTTIINLPVPMGVADGGTGATTASAARSSLGLGTIATQNASSVSITGGSITGITDLAIADGGTGASTAADARTNLGVTATGQDTTYAYRANNLADLANASSARTNLGLGTMATQNANNVSISGGAISGITDLAVADGGTGASSFTSGGILRGNGAAALSVASAADIVAAIGTTAVTNATNATTVTDGVYTTNFTGANQSLTTSGYQKIPGGLIIQWGTGQTFGGGGTVYLPISFPTAFVAVTANNTQTGPTSTYATSTNIIGLGAFQIFNENAVSLSYTWIAIGY